MEDAMSLKKLFEPSVIADDEGDYSFEEIQARAACPIPNGKSVDLAAAYREYGEEIISGNLPNRMKIAAALASRITHRGDT